MDNSETKELIERLRDLPDSELADAIIDCLRPCITRNAAKIKGSSIANGDFTTQFNLQVALDFFDGDSMSVKSTGFIEPNLFDATKTGKRWSTKK